MLANTVTGCSTCVLDQSLVLSQHFWVIVIAPLLGGIVTCVIAALLGKWFSYCYAVGASGHERMKLDTNKLVIGLVAVA